MSDPAKEVVEHKVRRAAGVHALRKIGKIVAEEQQADEHKDKVVRWFLRCGWLVALGAILAWAYWSGVI